MSYDITTEPDTGLDWNYTYNVQPMTDKAGLRSLTLLDGMLAAHATLRLTEVIAAMQEAPDEYRALNPKNGWGDFDGFLTRLKDLRDWLALHPKVTVRVG